MSDTERDDYANLIKSPGWLRVIAYAKQEWGATACFRKTRLAGKDIEKILAVVAGQDAIDDLIKFPERRLDRLSDLTEPAPTTTNDLMSRRGGL